MARSCHFGTAVQDKLNAEVDVITLGIACNLDAISERGQGSVRPATSAILRNVLVQRLGQVTLAVDVSPVEGIGELVGANVGVRQSRHVVAVDSIFADADFAKVLGGGQGEYRGKGESSVEFHDDDVVLDTSDFYSETKNYDTIVFFLFRSSKSINHRL